MSRTVELPNAQQLAGVWNSVKGLLREKWGELTDDELEQFKGNVERLVGRIQKTTGESRAEVEAFLSDACEAALGTMQRARARAAEFSSRAARAVQEKSENIANAIGETSAEARQFVRRKPGESIGIAFGAGFVIGTLLILLMRKR